MLGRVRGAGGETGAVRVIRMLSSSETISERERTVVGALVSGAGEEAVFSGTALGPVCPKPKRGIEREVGLIGVEAEGEMVVLVLTVARGSSFCRCLSFPLSFSLFRSLLSFSLSLFFSLSCSRSFSLLCFLSLRSFSRCSRSLKYLSTISSSESELSANRARSA